MSKVFSRCNQKGGVGKTTTSVNLSAALSLNNKKVLLIDMDPQGNATMGWGINKYDLDYSLADILLDSSKNVEDIICKAEEGFDLVPSNQALTFAEVKLLDVNNRELVLKKILAKIQDNYDFIIIDCPPSLGLLTINALSASDSVLIPIQCEYLALEGLGKLLNTVKSIQKIHNENLLIEGLLLTMYDTRLNLSNQVKKEVKTHFDEMVFKTLIHRNVRLGEATSYGKSIIDYDVSSKGADNYLNLAKELISKTHNG